MSGPAPDRHHTERFPTEPWRIREVGFDLETLAQSESLFALSNGHIGVRGNLDEGDPNGLPGTYLNSFYESRQLPYAEAGYGFPESGQTVLNVTNGKTIRLLVDDEPLDLRYGEVLDQERILDLRRGVLERTLDWQSPAGTRVRLKTTRLVSFTRRAMLAVRFRVEALDRPLRIVVQSELVANEETPAQSKDPRVAAKLSDALAPIAHEAHHRRALLMHRTRSSELGLACAMTHVVDHDGDHLSEIVAQPDWARFTTATELAPHRSFQLDKFVAYGWSSQRSEAALRDQVDAALASASHAGFDVLLHEQESATAEFWDAADVQIDGPTVLQQAVRFGIFHTYQAGARAEQRAIPAKGLTGPGYDGHAFWDSEMFVLPLLTATVPGAAADALRWRQSTLDLARERAQTLRLSGAAFPWRTIRGQECSAYWPAGTAAMHVNADIAAATERYVWWTGDEDFERDCAVPILVETARLWDAVGYFGEDERFHVDGVTGPDEYSAIVNDNLYTNLMAGRNLAAAAAVSRRWPEQASDLDVTDDEIRRWEKYAGCVAMPFNDEHGVHEQDLGFVSREVWDFEGSLRDHEYPLLLHAPYFNLYRKQVIKQADLALAMHWVGDAFTLEQKARNFAYYEPLTVRDSSLSACTQAVVAAEVGQLDLATDYLVEAALMDLQNIEHNSGDGLHIASLAGGWLACVAGFGGMRDLGERLTFRPQLPPGWRGMRFTVSPRGRRLEVDIDRDRVRYSVSDGDEPLEIGHVDDGGDPEVLTIAPGEPVERPWHPVTPLTDRPTQPPGRAPTPAAEALRQAEES